MAVPIEIVLYSPDEPTANGSAQAAFDRIRQLNAIFSDYDSESELRRLCATSGEGRSVPVSEPLWRVLTRAKEVSEWSEGAFDVTLGPMIRIWRRARSLHELPEKRKLDEARQLVGYHLMEFDPLRRAVELKKRGMRIDLGGIAKGYAAEDAIRVLGQRGITRAMVHAGGDICVGDPPPDKPGWIVALPPLEGNAPPSAYLCLSRRSIATSGDLEQYTLIDGRRYSHIVDPKTGVGLTDHSLVTIVAADGATADALATAVSVLGPQQGLKLVEKLPGVAARIVRAPQGKVERHESSRWKDLPVLTPNKEQRGRSSVGLDGRGSWGQLRGRPP
jgi:thiamine biosynthesis lipoprotein